MAVRSRSLAAICECSMSRPSHCRPACVLSRCIISEPLSSGRIPEELIAQFSAEYLAYRPHSRPRLKLPSSATLAHFPARRVTICRNASRKRPKAAGEF